MDSDDWVTYTADKWNDAKINIAGWTYRDPIQNFPQPGLVVAGNWNAISPYHMGIVDYDASRINGSKHCVNKKVQVGTKKGTDIYNTQSYRTPNQ